MARCPPQAKQLVVYLAQPDRQPRGGKCCGVPAPPGTNDRDATPMELLQDARVDQGRLRYAHRTGVIDHREAAVIRAEAERSG
jgi:hypothetical protein